MKRIAFIFLLLLTLSVSVLLSGCDSGDPVETTEPETPLQVLVDAIGKTAESRQEEDSDIWERALAGGSIELNATLPPLLPFTEIATKSVFAENASFESIALKNGSDTLDLALYQNESKMILTSSALSKAYGGTAEEFAKLLESLSNSSENTTNTVVNTQEAEDFVTASLALLERAEPLLEKYATITVNLTEDDLEIQLEVTAEKLSAFLDEFLNMARSDEEFTASFRAVNMLLGREGADASFENFLTDMDVDTLLSDLKEDPSALSLDITATRSRIIQSMNLALYEQEVSVETLIKKEPYFTFDLTLAKNGGFSFETEIEGETAYFEYDVTDTESRRKVMISIGVTGVTLTPITYTYNKTDSSYTLSLAIPATFSAELSGKITETEDTLTLTVDSATYSILSTDSILSPTLPSNLSITGTLVVKAVDTVPSAPQNFKNVKDLTEEDLTGMLTELSENPIFVSILEMLMTEEEPVDYPAPSGAYAGVDDYLIFDGNSVTHDKISSAPSGTFTIDADGVLTLEGEITLDSLVYDAENDCIIVTENGKQSIYTKMIEE